KDPKDTPRDFTSTARALDLWQKTPDGWKLRRMEMLSLSQTIDGKPVRLQFGTKGRSRAPKSQQGAIKNAVRVALMDDPRRADDGSAAGPGSFQLAQVFVTPYDYGWSGVTNVATPNYVLGPTGFLTSGPSYSTLGAYNVSGLARNREILAQQRQYEA